MDARQPTVEQPQSGPTKRRSKRLDRLVMVVLALGTLGWLLAVEGKQGFGRDEGQYFRAAERYWGWFAELADNVAAGHISRSFTRDGIDRYWSDNAPDHPVVMKTLYGISWRLLHRCHCTGSTRGLHPAPVRGPHRTLPLFARESTAFRFPAFLMAALLVTLVYAFCRRFVGPPAAAAGAVLTLAQPHFFFHAQISCFDAPITVMAFAVGFAYWKSLRSARWGILTGVVFGIALGTKHNAWLMPFFLAGHYLWMRRGDVRRRRIPPIPLAFVSMAVLGPLIFLMHWPWLWVSPIKRTEQYLNRHLQHEHYNFEYLDQNWNLPPRDGEIGRKLVRTTFPFVSTAVTVPVTTLVLAIAGGIVLFRRRRGQPVSSEPVEPLTEKRSWLRPGADVDRAPGAFVAAQVFGPLAVLAVPAAPIFGGVKHFMPAMPFLAVAAAIGLERMVRSVVPRVNRARLRAAVPVACAVLVCIPSVVETQRSHPDGLSHYNLLAGGFAGGASLGMNRQFWGYSVAPMLPELIRSMPRSNRMYWHDVIGDALSMYKREGRLPLSTGDTGPLEAGIPPSDMGILFYERHWALYEGLFWDAYGTTRPLTVREREGVPLVTVYRREGVR